MNASVRRGLLWYSAVATLVAVAWTVRWPWMGESLWLDELHTAWVVKGSWSDLCSRCLAGNQLPAYFALVKLVTGVAGLSEVAIRSVSLVAGMMLVVAAAWLVRSWSGSRLLGMTAGLAAAIDRHMVFYAVEARPYALVQLFTVVQLAGLSVLLYRPSWPYRASWILVNMILFWVHPTTVLLLAAPPAALAIAKRLDPGVSYRWRNLVTDLGVSCLTFPLAAGYLMQLADRRENWTRMVPRPSWLDLWTLYPLVVYMVLPAVLVVVVNRWRPADRIAPRHASRVHRGIWLCVSWIVVPMILAWLASATDTARLFMRRYLIGVSVPVICFPGLCAGLVPSGWGRTAVLAGITAAVLAISPWPQWDRRTQEDWRHLIHLLEREHGKRASPIVIDPGLIESRGWRTPDPSGTSPRVLAVDDPLRAFLLYPLRSCYELSVDDRLLHVWLGEGKRPVDNLTRQQAIGAGELWLIVRGQRPAADAQRRQLDRALDETDLQPAGRRSFGRNLWLFHWTKAG